jgi:hypothetical protein
VGAVKLRTVCTAVQAAAAAAAAEFCCSVAAGPPSLCHLSSYAAPNQPFLCVFAEGLMLPLENHGVKCMSMGFFMKVHVHGMNVHGMNVHGMAWLASVGFSARRVLPAA